jgi:TolB protein
MKNKGFFSQLILFLLLAVLLPGSAWAQYVSHYPALKGYEHHVYVEGYELPAFGSGPIDPVATADGKYVIFSAKGWLWRFDLAGGTATRLTRGGESDFQPAISADGNTLVFVRDNTRTMKIMMLDLRSGQESILVDSGKIDIDPVFSVDNRWVYYSSTAAGDMDIWKIDLNTKSKTQVTSNLGLEMRPLPLPDGRRIVFLQKSRPGNDQLCVLDEATGERTLIRSGSILSQVRPSLSPDGKFLAVNWPDEGHYQDYQLWLVDLEQPAYWINLTCNLKLPLTPAWSADQRSIFFVEADSSQTFILKKVPVSGGRVAPLMVKNWDWQEKTARLTIRTRWAGTQELLATRLNITDKNGHPLFSDTCNARFDSRNGLHYFHSPGAVEVTAPAGVVHVMATHGFTAPAVSAAKTLTADASDILDIILQPLWQPRKFGWYCGDNHFHLNYGGPYYLTPEQLLPVMQGEDLDVAVPMTANLNNRLMDSEWIGWMNDQPPLIHVGQELRSSFLGHVGVIGLQDWIWPWIYGPGYPIYGQSDISNGDVLQAARRQNAVNIYVHPIDKGNPFAVDNLNATPINLITDAILGNIDTLEIVCVFITPLGTSNLWYRLLNTGCVIQPTAGSDTFPGFSRNMVFGCTRLYAHIDGDLTWAKYMDAVRQGHSFATNGPLLDFFVNGLQPGSVLPSGSKTVKWFLDVYSPTAVQQVEILVNGVVVARHDGLKKAGKKNYSGTVKIPANGWIAARVAGGQHAWPMMDLMPFAHTAPIWIGTIGSREPGAARAAASDLLMVLDNAEKRLDQGYKNAKIPNLRAQFIEARKRLEKIRKDG